jgi:TPR repeat protein
VYSLGCLYEKGWGVAQDYGNACEWYLKAADAGSADAMNSLGCLAHEYGKARVVTKGRRRRQLACESIDSDSGLSTRSIVSTVDGVAGFRRLVAGTPSARCEFSDSIDRKIGQAQEHSAEVVANR